MNRLRTISAVALCSGLGIAGMQSPADRPAPVDAPALLAASSAVHRTASRLVFHCRYSETTTDGDSREAAADVVYRRGDTTPAFLYLKGAVSKPESFSFEAALVDGRMLVVDTAKKVSESRPWPRRSTDRTTQAIEDAKRTDAYEIVSEIFPVSMFAGAFDAYAIATPPKKSATIEGTVTLDGVLCDLVEVKIFIAPTFVDTPGLKVVIPERVLLHRSAIGRNDRLLRWYSWRRPYIHATSGIDRESMRVDLETTYLLTKPRSEEPSGKDPAPSLEGVKEGKLGAGRSVAEARTEGPKPGTGSLGGSKVVVGPMVGNPAPDFTVKDTDGTESSSAKLKGKHWLIHFAKLEDSSNDVVLAALKRRHGDRLIVLDLVVGGGPAMVAKTKKKLGFPRCIGGAEVAASWNLGIFPSAFFVGPDGKIAGKLPSGLGGPDAKARLEEFQRRTAAWLSNPHAILGE